MILAKMYLNHESYFGTPKYNECVTYANKVIGGGYSLATSYRHNFMADSNTNSARNEIIFPLQSDGRTTQNYGPTTVIINGEVGSIEGNGASLGVNGWGGALRVRKQFGDKFADAAFANDTRKTLITAGRNPIITTVSDRDSGYIITKFTNKTSTGVTAAQALGYVNSLRTRANGQTIAAADLTLDFILDERLRELHWEAHRRQDLIRFGKFTGGSYNWAWKGNGVNGVAIPAHFKLFPLPTESVAANPNLTQNTGY
jgi:hypothetical protein